MISFIEYYSGWLTLPGKGTLGLDFRRLIVLTIASSISLRRTVIVVNTAVTQKIRLLDDLHLVVDGLKPFWA